MADIQLPDNTKDLQRLYNETADHHNAYLAALEKAFEKHCDEIQERALHKIQAAGENDRDALQKIHQEEQAALDKTLQELKVAIEQSSRNAYDRLEQISKKMENEEANLEKELATL